MENHQDWAALHPDMLEKIAVCVNSIEDFMAFRGVCSSWRATASKEKFKPSQPSVPLLMLREKEDSDEREFYSLSRRKVCMRLSLPQLKRRKCVGLKFGWLLTLHRKGDASLFNPLTGAQITVPEFRSFPHGNRGDILRNPVIDDYDFTYKAVLSANPSETANFVLVVLVDLSSGLGVWRAGEYSWSEVKPGGDFHAICFHKDKLYAVSRSDHMNFGFWVWDPSGDDDLTMTSFILNSGLSWFLPFPMMALAHLVESSDGELLFIMGHGSFESGFAPNIGDVFRVDTVEGKWKPITGLGEDAVFLGRTASMSVSASAFPVAVKPNCVYFAADDSLESRLQDDYDLEKMGVYDVGNKSFESFGIGGSLIYRACLPLWIALSS